MLKKTKTWVYSCLIITRVKMRVLTIKPPSEDNTKIVRASVKKAQVLSRIGKLTGTSYSEQHPTATDKETQLPPEPPIAA